MTINIRTTSIKLMLDVVTRIKNNTITSQYIEEVLNHPDYKIEFRRYQQINKEEFIDYLLHVEELEENDITNLALRAHHPLYVDLFKRTEFYIEQLKQLNDFTKEKFQQHIDLALKGLPKGFEFKELNFIFTIGIGPSFGYVFEDYMHFDYLKIIGGLSVEDFFSSLSHEIHHIGLSQFIDSINLNLHKISLEELFYLHFAGEGLAVKYCNNAEGILSKSIYEGPKNVGLDPFTWEYLNNHFDETMEHFKQTVYDIRIKKIDSQEKLSKEIESYWMNTYTEDQKEGEIPKLLHFRLYSFGNEIWGVIHDVFGIETVYNTIKNLSNFPRLYNLALEKLKKEDYNIEE